MVGQKTRPKWSITIYPDGSKTDEGVGAGYVVISDDQIIHSSSYKLPYYTSVFQAELFALLEAAKYISSTGIYPTKVFTDSQSSILALQNRTIKNSSLLDTFNELQKAGCASPDLEINWIKAHVGHYGNETADKLAKEGTSLPDDAIIPNIPVPHSFLKMQNQLVFYNLWEEEWNKYPHARMTKQFYGAPSSAFSKAILNMNKHNLNTFIRAVTGHNALLYFRFKVDPDNNSPLCRFCPAYEYETTYHLINNCDRFAAYKIPIFNDATPDNNMEWDPMDVIKFLQHEDISSALDGYYDGVHYNDLWT
jgi:ribonuclease HI